MTDLITDEKAERRAETTLLERGQAAEFAEAAGLSPYMRKPAISASQRRLGWAVILAGGAVMAAGAVMTTLSVL